MTKTGKEVSEAPDKLLACADCGKDFPWTGREQEFFAERDFPAPKRCKECRQVNKQRFGGRQAGAERRDGSDGPEVA